MHNCSVASPFRYKLQFATLSDEAFSECSRGSVRLLQAPWQSITSGMACTMKLLGRPTECTDIFTLNAERARRLVTSTSPVAQRVFSEINAFADSMKAARNPCRRWQATSLVAALRGVRGELGPRAERATQFGREGALREVFPLLAGSSDERWARIETTLRSRLQRWSDEPGELMRSLRAFADSQPPAELACSVVRTACYGGARRHAFLGRLSLAGAAAGKGSIGRRITCSAQLSGSGCGSGWGSRSKEAVGQIFVGSWATWAGRHGRPCGIRYLARGLHRFAEAAFGCQAKGVEEMPRRVREVQPMPAVQGPR